MAVGRNRVNIERLNDSLWWVRRGDFLYYVTGPDFVLTPGDVRYDRSQARGEGNILINSVTGDRIRVEMDGSWADVVGGAPTRWITSGRIDGRLETERILYYLRDQDGHLTHVTNGDYVPMQRQTRYDWSLTELGVLLAGDGSRIRLDTGSGDWIELPPLDIRLTYMEPTTGLTTGMVIPAPNPSMVTPGVRAAVQERLRGPVINVQVKFDTYQWNIQVRKDNVELTLPVLTVIKGLVPRAYRKYIPNKSRRATIHYLRESLQAGLPPNILHDALKAWAFATVNQSQVGESTFSVNQETEDTSWLLKAMPATLLVGGKAFRLVPTGESNIKGVIAETRRKAKVLAEAEVSGIREKAKVEVGELKARATLDSRTIINQAEQKASNLRIELARERANQAIRPPQWLLDNRVPFGRDGERWVVGLLVSTRVVGIRLHIEEWAGTVWWDSVPLRDGRINQLRLWAPLISDDGRYEFANIKSETWETTHINTSSACMSLQGLPVMLDSSLALKSLQSAISRGMEVVNLNSPLDRHTSRYYPPFFEQLPGYVVKWLNREREIRPIRDEDGIIQSPDDHRAQMQVGDRWNRFVRDEEELGNTFTVRENVIQEEAWGTIRETTVERR